MTCTMRPRSTLRLLLLASCLLLCLSPCPARADGGTLCLLQRAGDYQVAVFSSPTPLRAGAVDISVLVQDASTGEQVPKARVIVCLTLRGTTAPPLIYPATTEAASNKLFHAAKFDLPEAGRWDVEVRIDGPLGVARVRCELEAAEPLPRWREVWPWVGWPVLVVVLFSVHQLLVRRRSRSVTVPPDG
jgi:hypothetical protein